MVSTKPCLTCPVSGSLTLAAGAGALGLRYLPIPGWLRPQRGRVFPEPPLSTSDPGPRFHFHHSFLGREELAVTL